jgi:protein ImuB
VDRWACVSLAALPLQIVARSKPEWRSLPTVVVSEDKPQGKVLWASSVALSSGVLPGQSYALALSLCTGLHACVVSEPEVTAAVAEIKTLLWSFSPQLEVADEAGVFWLDASGLERLYVTLEAWSAALRKQLMERDFHACVVVGFSRFGSYALARAQLRPQSCVLGSPSEETQRVAQVPLACLDIEPEFRDVLSKLGVHDIQALLCLPATGLLTRFGKTAARLHALAAGEFAPLQAETWLPPLLARSLLDNAESDSTRLLFVIKRLLTDVLKQLVLRAEALTSLCLRFVLDRKQGNLETEPLRPAVPTLDSVQLMDLVRLRLESLQLQAGAIEVELEATGIKASAEQLRVFVEQPRRDFSAANRAIARLRAELGPGAVVRAVLCDGHLPEACFSWQPLEALTHAAPPDPATSALPLMAASQPTSTTRREPVTQTLARRPLVRRIFHRPEVLSAPARQLRDDGWLIRGPQYGAVTHTAGPYLVNGGWWLKEVQREYQFVMTRRGELLWVYQDKRRRRWFLQGQVS